MKLEDFTPAVQKRIQAAIAGTTIPPQEPQPKPKPATKPATKRKGPTKTELELARGILVPRGVLPRYEAVTFTMRNGHRYTPDWTFTTPSGRLVCVEVKGAYKLPSYARARLAFDQLVQEWPDITWIWAEKRGERWDMAITGTWDWDTTKANEQEMEAF